TNLCGVNAGVVADEDIAADGIASEKIDAEKMHAPRMLDTFNILTDSTKAISFARLLKRFDESTRRIKSTFEALPLERLDEPYKSIRGTTLGDYLQFYVIVHESYHLGQLAILRENVLA
ncbi:MAG: DinB family protein, partial [Chloroflexota bacterium]